MKPYQPQTPRKLFGLAAIAMTALIIGVLVVAPAQLDGVDANTVTSARNMHATPPVTEVAISPARIDVVAIREQKTALERLRTLLDKRKQAG